MLQILVLSVFTYNIGHVEANQRSIELDLVANLTSDYDVNARPVANAADTVNMQIGIGLQQIIDLDEPTQVLSTSVFLRIFWNDAALMWDPDEYDNITSIRLTVTRIWRPDIALYNDVSTDRRNIEMLYPATIYNDGTVAWLSPTILVSSCNLNMRYFPWDEQECELELGSWTYDSAALSLSKYGDGGDISVFIENGEWDLISMPSEILSATYACCPNPFQTAVFTIKIARKPMYYLINIVLPCVFVSFVGLLVFILPPASGEKVSLSVTILLASTVFLLIVAEALPPQSTTVPLVSQYFEAVIGLLALSCIASVFIINIHHRGDEFPPPNKYVRFVFFDILARVVFMRHLVTSKVHPTEQTQKPTNIFCTPVTEKEKLNSLIFTTTNGNIGAQDNMKNDNKLLKLQELDQTNKLNAANENLLLKNIMNEVKSMNISKDERDEKRPSSVGAWILIAMILDRICLVIFMMVTTITSLTILLDR